MRNPRFDAVLKRMEEVHDKKNADYAEDGNPYSNFEFAARVAGCSVDTVFRVLVGVKLARLNELLKGKAPQNETLEDSLLDLAVYSTIWASYRGVAAERPTDAGGTLSSGSTQERGSGASPGEIYGPAPWAHYRSYVPGANG